MNHVCIVGAGLAGACAAAALSQHATLTLLDGTGPACGASGVAAGIVNPFMGLRARPVWRYPHALRALDAVLHRVDLLTPPPGLVRPARGDDQARLFQHRADEHSGVLAWLEPSTIQERWPEIQAPYGALHVREGRAVDVAHLTRHLLKAAQVDLHLGESGQVERVDDVGRVFSRTGAFVQADVVLLCLGSGTLPGLSDLPLHHIKGQIARFHAPSLTGRLPILAGDGYVVPEGDTVLVGSTFEHDFTDVKPSEAGTALLREKATALIPALKGADLVETRAGIRVTVPGTRLPLLGPISRSGRIWVFNGLGAKGLLTAPLLASRLRAYLNDPSTLPAEVRPPVVM